MSIEPKGKLINLLECLVTKHDYLHISTNYNRLGKVFGLRFVVIVPLANACLERTVEVKIIKGQFLLNSMGVNQLEVIVA